MEQGVEWTLALLLAATWAYSSGTVNVSTSGCRARAFSAVLGWLAACSAPDGSTLYRPLGSGGEGSLGTAGSSGTSAAGSGSPGGVPSSTGASGATSTEVPGGEGQGGATLVNGDEGSAGSNTAGGGDGADAGLGADAGAGDGGAADVVPPPCIPGSEVCDGLDNDCDDAIDPGGTCAADCVGFALAEHGYMYCADSLARATVLARCESEGMHLAWLETPGESEDVLDEIIASGLDAPDDNDEILTWIGASDAEDEGEWFWAGNGAIAGSFQFWTGGAPPEGGVVDGAYVAWSPGEPTGFVNEHCAAISVLGNAMHDPGVWDDRSCNEVLPFVCEAS